MLQDYSYWIYYGSIKTQVYDIRDPSSKSQDIVSYFHVDSSQQM